MSFKVEFEDGDVIWIPFNKDLAASTPFEKFCLSKPELQPLLYTLDEWKKKRREINAKGIAGVKPGEVCYIDLRAWGWSYMKNIGLPDIFEKTYVIQCRYMKWTGSKKQKIDVRCDLFDQLFEWTAVDVNAYGRNLFLTEKMVLIDEELCRMYPKILE
jgi:hypothetical protein